jgi:hypothetical protein
MKPRLYTLLVVFLSLFAVAEGAERREPIRLFGDLEVGVEIEYRAPEDNYVFDFPLYGDMGLLYQGAVVESALSLELIEEVSIGESYIMGGSGFSYLKLGFLREDWGKGYSASVIDILNMRDDRYPENFFYRNEMRPNPLFLLSIGKGDMAGQIALSHKEENIESVNDALLGIQSFVMRTGVDISVGTIREIGNPPPLFFLGARGEGSSYGVWMEFGWWYYGDGPDRVDTIIGARQDLARSQVTAEFILEKARPFLFFEEKIQSDSRILFNLRGYTYLKSFSTAINGYIETSVDEKTILQLGTYLFFGGRGTYFSRFIEPGDNDNTVYIKLYYAF